MLIEDNERNLQKLRGKKLLLYHSANDTVISVKQSLSFVKKAEAAKIDVEFHRLKTRSHNIRPTAKEFKRIIDFLKR